MNSTAQQALNTTAQSRAAAAALAVVLTLAMLLAMLLGVDPLATSDAPAWLIAQLTGARD